MLIRWGLVVVEHRTSDIIHTKRYRAVKTTSHLVPSLPLVSISLIIFLSFFLFDRKVIRHLSPYEQDVVSPWLPSWPKKVRFVLHSILLLDFAVIR